MRNNNCYAESVIPEAVLCAGAKNAEETERKGLDKPCELRHAVAYSEVC